MLRFELDKFMGRIRQAASEPMPEENIETLMCEAFRQPESIRGAMAAYEGEEELLFEDESVSIWYCGFDPAKHLPPHDHQATAVIGVYAGREINHFYRPAGGSLERTASRELRPGSVLRISPEDIHSVETADDQWSYGIHVYLAALTAIDRSLYDWTSGAAEPFSDERFAALTRASSPVR